VLTGDSTGPYIPEGIVVSDRGGHEVLTAVNIRINYQRGKTCDIERLTTKGNRKPFRGHIVQLSLQRL